MPQAFGKAFAGYAKSVLSEPRPLKDTVFFGKRTREKIFLFRLLLFKSVTILFVKLDFLNVKKGGSLILGKKWAFWGCFKGLGRKGEMGLILLGISYLS